MAAQALVELPPRRGEAIQVFDPIPVLDTARFEHMQRIATTMAHGTLVPESLVCRYEGSGQNRRAVPLPFEAALANCFLVVNQAVRWNMDPFAVAQCCSIVHGRLMYEGKLVAAVLAAKLGIQLSYEWNDRQGDAFGIRVSGPPDKQGVPRVIEGTVGQWKTTGTNSPWSRPQQARLQLAYRGTREWCRLYEPAILLGVYTEDELEHLASESRATRARDVTPPQIASAGPPRRQKTAQAPEQDNSRPTPDPEPEVEDLDAIVAEFAEQISVAPNDEALGEIAERMSDVQLTREMRTRLEAAFDEAKARIARASTKEGEKPETDDEADTPRGQLLDRLRGRAMNGAGALRLALRKLTEDEAKLLTEGDRASLEAAALAADGGTIAAGK